MTLPPLKLLCDSPLRDEVRERYCAEGIEVVELDRERLREQLYHEDPRHCSVFLDGRFRTIRTAQNLLLAA